MLATCLLLLASGPARDDRSSDCALEVDADGGGVAERVDPAGTSLDGAGDVDGDGDGDFIIGAPGVDQGGASAGAAYGVISFGM